MNVSQEPPPVAFDSRQQRINEQLVRLGPAPAAFFRDACRLFQNLAQLEAAGNLAGHLLREIKGSIKDVLYPREVREESDQDAIEAIVDEYGLPKDHPIVSTWPNLRLHALAHRGALASPRQLVEVQEAWEELQVVLAVLLDALDSAYIVIYERLDRLLAKQKPGKDDLAELLGKIPNNPHTLSYFFGRVQGRGWFELVAGSPIFDDPPRDGYWPQAQYLRRVAADFPDEVAPILERAAATWSYYTQHEIVEATPLLPAAAAGRILNVSARSVMSATGHDTFLAEDIAQRAAAIASSESDAALDVFATLLELKPTVGKPQSGYGGARSLASPLEYHTYDEVIGKPLKTLMAAAPRRTFARLLDLLSAALAAVFGETKPNDTSKGWMPAIEPHAQNAHHHVLLPRLAEAVRDSAEVILRGDPAALPDVLEKLDAAGWQVLQRIGLHLCRLFGDPAAAVVQTRVLDANAFVEYDNRHEYAALLKKVFPALSEPDKATILERIKAGPRLMPERITSENAQYLRQRWTWLRLSWIREHLATKDADLLAELEKTHGTAGESNEFSGYISGPFRGPTSPKNEDELRAMSISELVAFLRDWRPSRERFSPGGFAPTREGLSRSLQAIVKSRSVDFATAADAFIGLDATFVRGVITGFEDAVRDKAVIAWEPVLRLCEWAVVQPRTIPGRDGNGFDNDPDWSWTWTAIGRLLRTAFGAEGAAALPLSFRRSVWNILSPITDDPDPDQARETAERDSNSTAINSTRGVAMEAVVRYAIWVRERRWVVEGVSGFADMPEVEKVLNRHLDATIDSSRAIRAVYGEWLFYLYQMNKTWVREHLSALFSENHPELADAVLHSYLAWGRYTSPELNRLLLPQFQRTIESFQAVADNEEEVLAYVEDIAQRLTTMYLHGELELGTDSLLSKLFALAGEETRARTLFLVPSVIGQAEEEAQAAMRKRAIALWEWRLASATDTELRAFGGWMEHDKFDPAWRLAQLRQVLEQIGTVDMTYRTAEILGRLATQFPAETLRCAQLLVGGANIDVMRAHRIMYRGDLQRIIHTARTSGDEKVRRQATAFANALVAHGLQQFRAVLDPEYEPPAVPDEG